MTIDFSKTKLIPVSEVPDILSHVSYGTVRNWYQKGCVSHATGDLVKLDVIQIGHRFFTSKESVDSFIQALNGGNRDGNGKRDNKGSGRNTNGSTGRRQAKDPA